MRAYRGKEEGRNFRVYEGATGGEGVRSRACWCRNTQAIGLDGCHMVLVAYRNCQLPLDQFVQSTYQTAPAD